MHLSMLWNIIVAASFPFPYSYGASLAVDLAGSQEEENTTSIKVKTLKKTFNQMLEQINS